MKYVGTCPKCGVTYQWYDEAVEPPSCGTFCPNCKDLGYSMRGVIHFEEVKPEFKAIFLCIQLPKESRNEMEWWLDQWFKGDRHAYSLSCYEHETEGDLADVSGETDGVLNAILSCVANHKAQISIVRQL